jgi:tetratricopeptide (TPR) repeat protein
MLYTTLDVLRPAKIAFEKDATDLLLVNNSIVQPADYGHRTTLLNDRARNTIVKTDSLALFCLGALHEEINGKDFFSSVQFIPNSLNMNTDFGSISQISPEKISQMSQKYGTNVVLSLDKIKVNDDLTEYYIAESNFYAATLELRFETYWSIHYPGRKDYIQVYYKDTVFWESESYVRRKAINGLPNRGDALVDGALLVGQKTVNRFIPYWDKVDRYFYDSKNKQMKQAMDSVYVKNWDAAILQWKKVMDTHQSSFLQAQAANNIAIAYEIIGDIDKAIEYVKTSFYLIGTLTFSNYDSFVRASEYMNELIRRKKELESIKKQLGE